MTPRIIFALIVSLLFALSSSCENECKLNTFTILGKGDIFVASDIARVYLQLSANGNNQTDALTKLGT